MDPICVDLSIHLPDRIGDGEAVKCIQACVSHLQVIKPRGRGSPEPFRASGTGLLATILFDRVELERTLLAPSELFGLCQPTLLRPDYVVERSKRVCISRMIHSTHADVSLLKSYDDLLCGK
jgi:hypothetical protein